MGRLLAKKLKNREKTRSHGGKEEKLKALSKLKLSNGQDKINGKVKSHGKDSREIVKREYKTSTNGTKRKEDGEKKSTKNWKRLDTKPLKSRRSRSNSRGKSPIITRTVDNTKRREYEG